MGAMDEQSQNFCGVETKSTLIHTRHSASKMFAKFGCQARTFCNKKEEKAVSQFMVRQTITEVILDLVYLKILEMVVSRVVFWLTMM